MLEDEKGGYIWRRLYKENFNELKDWFIIAVFADSNSVLWDSFVEVIKCMRETEIPDGKIVDRYVSIPTYVIIEFLKQAKVILMGKEISRKAAEFDVYGVYKGRFAKEIN